MTLVPPVPLLVPTGQGRGLPAGAGTGAGALKVLGGDVQVCTCKAVTWAVVPVVVTVVMRICSTPLNVPVSVGTSQPVFWWLSRSRRIWKVAVAAEAAVAEPSVSSRRANAILARAGIQELIGKSPRQRRPVHTSAWRPGHDGQERDRCRTA